ncbi:uncharacterized protein LOC124945752 isoform X2 [Impatiens glandulifera]|uniref:uncharacterized protein LOC124945752 isoform X2 n=1 Tax=Impatiens glandulifera TaxID=253017 RepID=UPI001FB19392|nr:uncharacterized protein LOC124945752 isoform X2 [Impatiens glandulifera]
MAFNFRHWNNHAALWHQQPPSGELIFFAGHALREDFHGLSSFRQHIQYFPLHPMDPHFAIQREMEKKIIREEIIEAEILRRRLLEEEVRRELMLERHMALHGELESIHPSSMLSDHRSSDFQSETTSIEKRLEGSESRPFQRSSKPMILEVKPRSLVSEGNPITMGKPIMHLSGLKRKADTPLEAVSTDGLPISASSKKTMWSCSLCHVDATCESGLKAHLNGKKHKCKELKLRRNNNNNNNIEENKLEPLEEGEIETLLEAKTDSLPKKEEEEDSTVKKKVEESNEVGEMKVKTEEGEIEDKMKTDNSNKLKLRCDICKVGPLDLKPMRDHKMGKKHLRNVKLFGGRVIPTVIKKILPDN